MVDDRKGKTEDAKEEIKNFVVQHHKELMSYIKPLNVEIWVSKENHFIHKMRMTYDLPHEFFSLEKDGFKNFTTIGRTIEGLSIVLEYTLSKINEEVIIEKPPEAVDFNKLIEMK
jgi:hypothetical protein